MFAKIKKINVFFLFIILLLILIGTGALYSAAGGNFEPWAKKHIIRFCFSFALILMIALVDIKILYKYAYLYFLASLILLGSVEILGSFGFGAKRWIYVFGLSIQPSELIKITLILSLAKYYHDLRFDRIGKIHNVFIPMLMIIIPFFLIASEPDLGTSIMYLLLGLLIMFVAGVRIWKFILGFIFVLFSFPILWNYIKPYQQKRVLSFLYPESDPLGQGYQLIQSKIALGSGGITGKGFLKGTQSYLEYLPGKQTDFIFTLIGEEFGFFGTIFVIILFIFLILIAYYISFRSNHVFGKILCLGVSINIFLYVILNVAMVIGLTPVVGVPLPLLSYGGTAMLSVMISFGFLMNISVNNDSKSLSNVKN